MPKMECENCMYATHARVLVRGNMTMITTSRSSINCTNKHIESITINGDDMICSGFAPKIEADELLIERQTND